MSTAETQVKPLEQKSLAEALTDLKPEVEKVLPAHVSSDKFMRIVNTAISQSPDLYYADRRSLLTSCVACAQDGLLPDGREAALVIFNTKEKRRVIDDDGRERQVEQWIKKVQYMPMVWGIVKKVRNSGELKTLSSNVVYEADEFDYWLDDTGEHIKHKPNLLKTDRGQMLAVYAIAETKDGGVYIEVMTRSQIEQVKSVSRAKSGPWESGWYDEMSRKTVIRRLSKRLPMSTDLEAVVQRDDDMYDLNGRALPRGGQATESGVAAARSLLGVDPPPAPDGGTEDGETVEDDETGDDNQPDAGGEAQQQSAIPQYDEASAIKALEGKQKLATLKTLYNEIAKDFAETERELPDSVQAKYQEMHDALSEKEL